MAFSSDAAGHPQTVNKDTLWVTAGSAEWPGLLEPTTTHSPGQALHDGGPRGASALVSLGTRPEGVRGRQAQTRGLELRLTQGS